MALHLYTIQHQPALLGTGKRKDGKSLLHCKLSSIICSLFLHICMWCGSLVMYLFIYSLITRKMLKPSNRNDSWMCFSIVSHHKNTLILILISPSKCRCAVYFMWQMVWTMFFQKWRDSLHENLCHVTKRNITRMFIDFEVSVSTREEVESEIRVCQRSSYLSRQTF